MTADLIARLEAAESGSRELDLEIWGNHVAVPRSPRPWKLNVTPPAYTTSLDAITALIGEKLRGQFWSVAEHPDGYVATIAGPFHSQVKGVTLTTAPLALSVALLRALDQGGESNG